MSESNYEKWMEIDFSPDKAKSNYSISNMGRVKSFAVNKTDGKILKKGLINGYNSVAVKLKSGKNKSYYVHRLVAEHFIGSAAEGQQYVIHLDYNKTNNHVYNLKWATQSESAEHNNLNPAVIKRKTTGYKLTETKVRQIKKLLKSKKTRLSMIAKQFGITHTQLNRIRSGENWGHVTIEE